MAATPSGAWAGRAGHVASFGIAGWRYTVPREGCVAWLRDMQRFAVRTASGWTDDGWPAAGIRIGTRIVLSGTAPVVALPSGGGTIDAEARAAIAALAAALRGAGGSRLMVDPYALYLVLECCFYATQSLIRGLRGYSP